jgi:hypothetical protein
MILFHYTKYFNLPSIFRLDALLPSPPLPLYGLARGAVEANPGAHGFCTYRVASRRVYHNGAVPHFACPEILDEVAWFEGEHFAVAFTAAPWCGSALGYMPPEAREGGVAYRLVVDLAGLDTFGWEQYQQRTNVPGFRRRTLGELARAKGDDPSDWRFVPGAAPLRGRLMEFEQYHRGRWISAAQVVGRDLLAELHAADRGKRLPLRHEFHAVFAQLGRDRVAPHALTSLFVRVALSDGRFVADHAWVRQSWGHLRGGDRVAFFAEVVAYPKGRGEAGYTLANVNGLRVLERRPAAPGAVVNLT